MKTRDSQITVISLIVLCILVFQACKEEENQAPDCEINAPSNGEEFLMGEVVPISVSANDPDGTIAEVEFFIDNVSKGSVNNSPYSYEWDTNGESLGNHTIKAISVDNEGASTRDEIIVDLVEVELSAFTANPTMGDAPLIVQFTDQSIENPTSWNWDFGDGESSTEQSPSHTYSNMGLYDVTLATTHASVSDSKTMQDFIIVKETFTDPRDNQTYRILTIGDQTWFAENLNFETEDSWWYENNEAIGDIHGRLYTWHAAQTACPAGWHTSRDSEWKELEMYLGMSQEEADNTMWRGTDEGKKLKSLTGWEDGMNGIDVAGFTAIPAGVYDHTAGTFVYLENFASWWTYDEYDENGAWRRYIEDANDQLGRVAYNKGYGYSIRCVKD